MGVLNLGERHALDGGSITCRSNCRIMGAFPEQTARRINRLVKKSFMETMNGEHSAER